MTTGAWGFVLAAVATPLLMNEAQDCAPALARWLLRWGARRIGQPGQAERYEEEWLADLDRIPGKLTKLAHACGVVTMSVPRLRAQFRRGRHRAPLSRVLSARRAAGISAKVTRNQQLDTTLQLISQMLVPQFADHCFIDLAQGDTLIRRIQHNARDWKPPAGTWTQPGEQVQYPAGHFCHQAMTRQETVLLTDIRTLKEIPAPSAQSKGLSVKVGVTSVLSAPLCTRGGLLGVISVARSGLTTPIQPDFTTSDRDQFTALAAKIAAVIDSTTLPQAEIRSALGQNSIGIASSPAAR